VTRVRTLADTLGDPKMVRVRRPRMVRMAVRATWWAFTAQRWRSAAQD